MLVDCVDRHVVGDVVVVRRRSSRRRERRASDEGERRERAMLKSKTSRQTNKENTEMVLLATGSTDIHEMRLVSKSAVVNNTITCGAASRS